MITLVSDKVKCPLGDNVTLMAIIRTHMKFLCVRE